MTQPTRNDPTPRIVRGVSVRFHARRTPHIEPNRLIARHMVSLGTVSSTLVQPREVFRPAITDGASNVIIAHNHPSGETCPSAEDIKITKQLIEAGKHLEIRILDHLIIGGTGFLSLRESGLVTFD